MEYLKNEYVSPALQIVGGGTEKEPTEDEFAIKVLKVVVENNNAGIAFIQRKCAIGFHKAWELIEWMKEKGYVSAEEGKPRTVLLTKEQFVKLYEKQE